MDRQSFVDQLFRQAATLAAINESEKLMRELESEDITVPADIYARIKDTFLHHKLAKPSAERYRWRIWPKLAATFLLGVVMTLILTMTVPAFADWMTKLAGVPNQGFTEYTLEANAPIDKGPEQFIITYIPEGFKLTQYQDTGLNQMYYYEDENSHHIVIDFLHPSNVVGIDNENPDEKMELLINDSPAVYTSKKGESSIIWESQSYFIIINTTLSKADTIKIAQGIKK